MQAAGSYSFISPDGEDGLNVVIPKSIDYRRLSHKAACELFRSVEDVIEAERGVKVDALLKETEKAA